MNSEKDIEAIIKMELKIRGFKGDRLTEAASILIMTMERRGKGFDDAYRLVKKYLRLAGKGKAPD